MRTFLIAGFVFAAAVAAASTSQAQFRDAGSKIRGDAYEGTSNAIRSYGNYNYAPVYAVRTAPMTAQPQQAIVQAPAAPARAPANATAAVDNNRSGTRTFSVEPQATSPAPTMTYRTYAPRGNYSRVPWMYRADHKVLGHFNP